ncbi:hypothetical protein BAUCODRAFT_425435 [Baudoinia panamericana UAMH 10762]|uniref:Pre-rRNA-processing protein IPI3 n=1 Tax=Baudoinia panamericana (strain UAMH 10762) TaxID=717646 RepID=M2N381_BAUPA|nr:uncharacterized protein BAUCODRAFT_425435 [Baudoinia panamericana UAMH 10762]EMC98413.1 hypothetical protein BAUCODRAFT_425435 [Baudoinia panamericana UAMH 10762]
MLTEHFIASIGVPEKPPGTNVAKDAAIFLHEFQPLAQQRAIFKKSATPANCLAVSESHIFAAQSDKAVVHVYNRLKGNQEATVPFTERVTCIALACDDTVLVLGTAEGRIFLWETHSGRQVTTVQSHLQKVTALAVDASSNFLLSASADSTVQVWSLPGLLSFANVGAQGLSPLRTFASHRTEVTAVTVGHSVSFSNFAVSAARDRTCLLWDFHTNTVLRTYLLSSLPLCITLDAADRAVYLGCDDGSVQQLDLYRQGHSTSAVQGGEKASVPIQPAASSRWRQPDALKGAALSVSLSFDSSTLLTGHQSGSVVAWDVATGRAQTNLMQNPLPGPVTNLCFLPVTGFAYQETKRVKVTSVMKPKFGAFDSAAGTVPGNYAINVELTGSDLGAEETLWQQALTAPSFPQALLDEGLGELASWSLAPERHVSAAAPDETEDFMALDGDSNKRKEPTLEEQNAALRAQIEALRRLQTASFDRIDKINAERKALIQREHARLMRGGEAQPNGVDGNSYDESDDGD